MMRVHYSRKRRTMSAAVVAALEFSVVRLRRGQQR